MPILEKKVDQEPTLEQKKELIAKRLVKQVQDVYNNLRQSYQDIYRMVWENPRELTPQQVLDGLGSEAAELFQLAGILLQTLETANPGSTDDLPKSDPSRYTINDDGTVTINK